MCCSVRPRATAATVVPRSAVLGRCPVGGTVAGRCVHDEPDRRVSGAFVLRSSLPGGAPVNNLRDFIRALARSRFGKTTSHQPSARRTDGSA